MSWLTMKQARVTRCKDKQLATILNGAFPGAGFFYLGLWKYGLINLVLAQGIMLGCFYWGEPRLLEHIHWVILVVMVGSASWVRQYWTGTRVH